MKRDSLLFLVPPAPGARDEAVECRDSCQRGSPVRSDLLHITVCWLGYLPDQSAGLVARARAAAASLRMASFRLMFDRLIAGPASLLLKSEEAIPGAYLFQRRLLAALASNSVRPPRGWRYEPHVTLRRGRQEQQFDQSILPISWTVNRLLLVRSEIGHARHVILGEWSLD